jgi:hypothetical protein
MSIDPRVPGALMAGAAAFGSVAMAAMLVRDVGPTPPPTSPAVIRAALPAPGPVLRRVRTIAVPHREPVPVRIQVPAIGVDAPLIRLGLDPTGSLDVPPRPEQAGWFGRTARPGERGAAVIAGHVDSTTGPAVFYRLGTLRRRDVIRVRRRDGSAIAFRVRRVERWPKDRFPTSRVYTPTPGPTLRLITCGGAFNARSGHYVDNTIVFATRG